jgi:hypothetical protein
MLVDNAREQSNTQILLYLIDAIEKQEFLHLATTE